MNQANLNICYLRVLRFPQRCWWSWKSLWVLHCVCWYTVTDITNDRASFILKAKQFTETSVTLRL